MAEEGCPARVRRVVAGEEFFLDCAIKPKEHGVLHELANGVAWTDDPERAARDVAALRRPDPNRRKRA
ncbi:hypothetical protein SEA_MOLLYMUR_98 [Gordonia phage Mollymur]|uniref:Uncharacterized protein n=1 Tax=Gordonia phage Mollymur TaxID=2590895 RepID=A0A4Y6EA49_9CAUD|nr:hypothetical protein PQB84_gp028 [Gordonia phage Mollymur]QDF15458.1 hypothetical protein SEA_MOLLYMUR_98 [Gordonia phage Mollymur]